MYKYSGRKGYKLTVKIFTLYIFSDLAIPLLESSPILVS